MNILRTTDTLEPGSASGRSRQSPLEGLRLPRIGGWSALIRVAGPVAVLVLGAAAFSAAVGAEPVVAAGPVSLSLTPSPVQGGDRILAAVGPLSAGASSVSLSSDNSNLVKVPDSVAAPGGGSSANFWIDTFPVTVPTTVHVTASAGDAAQVVTLTLLPAVVTSVEVKPAGSLEGGITGGGAGDGTVGITSKAGPGGALVSLLIAQPGSSPAKVTAYVLPGMNIGYFRVPTAAVVKEETLSIARLSRTSDEVQRFGAWTPAAGIEVLPFGLQTVRMLSTRLRPGTSVDGIVALDGPAPDGGAAVSFTTDRPDLLSLPSDVNIPPGSNATAFSLTAHPVVYGADQPVHLTVSYGGLSRTLNLKMLVKPTAPTGLTATSTEATSAPAQVKLTWTDHSGNEDAFAVWRKSAGSDWTRIGVLAPNTTTFTDTTAAPNTAYTYLVRATCDIFASDWSNDAVVKTPKLVPTAPTGVQAITPSANKVILTWTDASSDEAAFEIWRKTGSGNYAFLSYMPANSTSFVDTTVSAGLTYTYTVRAINVPVASSFTKGVTVTVSAPAP